MPIIIKISLTFYIIFISISVIIFELYVGNPKLIFILIFVTFLMTAGIWIFPEVIIKKNSTESVEKKYNE